MKKILLTSLAMGFLVTGMATTAHADFYDFYEEEVYIVGSSLGGLAFGPTYDLTDYIGGIPIITWTFNVETAGWATLTITAEGVDSEEDDAVFFNNFDNEIGYLTQQGFRDPSFNLQPGPGALPTGATAITTTYFHNIWAQEGINTVRVVVDPDYWVNEIESSTLTVNPVPEPTTLLLFGTGLAGLAAVGRRKRN